MIHYQIGSLPPDLPKVVTKHLPSVKANGEWEDLMREHSFYAAVYYQLALNLNAQTILELGTRKQESTQIFISLYARHCALQRSPRERLAEVRD